MTKKTTSRKLTSKTHAAALARIWQAAEGLVSCNEDQPFGPATTAGLAPFLESALELAAASVATPREDLTPLLELAEVALESAIQLLPSLADCISDKPPAAKVIKTLQVRLVRDAVKILRAFSSTPIKSTASSTSSDEYEPYTTTPAAQLEEPDPTRLWMIEHLWQRAGTGIIGGGAKGAKTWLALDLALSVASGTPALDTFPVHRPGGVVYVSAEGGEGYVKQRLNALCAQRGLSLDSLPHRLEIIPRAIRIDTAEGLGRLRATVKALAPTLLVLDPLVRLHRLDENSASSVSGLLSNLTELQQTYDLAIVLVHHATKQGARSREMSGQDFRGSSDFYAWGDSNIFVKKGKPNRFVISAEHRAAPATEKWTLRASEDENPHLEVIEGETEDPSDQSREADDQRIHGDILDLVRREGAKTKTELRREVKGRNDRVGKAVDRLAAEGKLVLTKRGWALATTNGKVHAPGPS